MSRDLQIAHAITIERDTIRPYEFLVTDGFVGILALYSNQLSIEGSFRCWIALFCRYLRILLFFYPEKLFWPNKKQHKTCRNT